MDDRANGATRPRPRRGVFGPAPTIGTADAFKQVAEDTSALVKAEIALAKAELMEGVKAKATGAGMFAAAGVLVAIASLGLLLTIGFVLAEVAGLPGWASALIVSGALLLIAGILALVGKKTIASADISVETTKRNVEEDIAWAKQRATSR
jgi:hypothetical protein